MKAFLFITAFCATFFSTNAQEIIIVEKTLGNQYYQNGLPIKFKDMLYTMETVPEAYELMAKAKMRNDFANVAGFVGGFGLGFAASEALFFDDRPGNNTYNFAPLFIGVLGVAVSIPLSISANKRAQQAVMKYNNALFGKKRGYSFQGIFNGNGVGVALRF